jgi:hypothetical protein
MTLTLQSSIFFFYVVICHFHLFMVCVYLPVDLIRKSMLCAWELFKTKSAANQNKKVNITGIQCISFKVIILQILLRYNCNLLSNYTYVQWFISYPLFDCRFHIISLAMDNPRVPNFDFGRKAGVTDQQRLLTHPTFAIVGGPYCPTL